MPKGSDIQTTDDLGGATVGAQDATTGEAYVQDETDASEVRGYPEGPDALNALRAGQVDAVVIDEPVAEDAVKKFGDLEITQIPTGELYGFAFAQDNDALREDVNGALKEMKDDGTIDEAVREVLQDQAALGGPGGHARAQLERAAPRGRLGEERCEGAPRSAPSSYIEPCPTRPHRKRRSRDGRNHRAVLRRQR